METDRRSSDCPNPGCKRVHTIQCRRKHECGQSGAEGEDPHVPASLPGAAAGAAAGLGAQAGMRLGLPPGFAPGYCCDYHNTRNFPVHLMADDKIRCPNRSCSRFHRPYCPTPGACCFDLEPAGAAAAQPRGGPPRPAREPASQPAPRGWNPFSGLLSGGRKRNLIDEDDADDEDDDEDDEDLPPPPLPPRKKKQVVWGNQPTLTPRAPARDLGARRGAEEPGGRGRVAYKGLGPSRGASRSRGRGRGGRGEEEAAESEFMSSNTFNTVEGAHMLAGLGSGAGLGGGGLGGGGGHGRSVTEAETAANAMAAAAVMHNAAAERFRDAAKKARERLKTNEASQQLEARAKAAEAHSIAAQQSQQKADAAAAAAAAAAHAAKLEAQLRARKAADAKAEALVAANAAVLARARVPKASPAELAKQIAKDKLEVAENEKKAAVEATLAATMLASRKQYEDQLKSRGGVLAAQFSNSEGGGEGGGGGGGGGGGDGVAQQGTDGAAANGAHAAADLLGATGSGGGGTFAGSIGAAAAAAARQAVQRLTGRARDDGPSPRADDAAAPRAAGVMREPLGGWQTRTAKNPLRPKCAKCMNHNGVCGVPWASPNCIMFPRRCVLSPTPCAVEVNKPCSCPKLPKMANPNHRPRPRPAKPTAAAAPVRESSQEPAEEEEAEEAEEPRSSDGEFLSDDE